MAIKDKLKAVLTLDISKFKRKSKEAKRDLEGVGTQAEKTSKSGTASMGKMALAVAAIGAAAIKTIENLDKMSKDIAKATADAAAREKERFGRAAGTVSTPAVLAAQDVSRGQTASQITQEALTRAAQFAIRNQEGPLAIKTAGGIALGADITPERTRAEELALLFQGATGSTGEAAGNLLKISRGKLLQHTEAESRKFFSGVAGAAADSDLDPGGFANVFAGVGALFQSEDIESGRAVGLISALSLSAKGQPERVETAARRILGLALKKNDFVKKAIAEGGGDPESRNALDIADALAKYILADPANEEALKQEGQVDRETIESLKQIAKPGARLAAQTGQRLFLSTGVEFLEKKLKDKLKEQTTRERGAQLQQEAASLAGFDPGTLGEAGLIQRQLSAGFAVRGGRERQNKIVEFGVKTNKAQASPAGGDTKFTEEQIKELFELNELFPEIDAALDSIVKTESAMNPGARGAHSAAKGIRDELRRAKSEANSRQTWWGEQVEELPAYKAAMGRAIQFLRQVELGKIDIDTPGTGQIKTEQISQISQRKAAGVSVGGLDLTEAAGVVERNNIKIENNYGSNSRATHELKKTDKVRRPEAP